MTISKIKKHDYQQLIELLQSTMRPNDWTVSIDEEYPLLFTDLSSAHSYGVYEKEEIVAHLNYFPRALINANKEIIGKVALIANVASSEKHRSQGHIRKLLSHLESKAKDDNMDAFILWSDLSSFYQKLNYQSLGKEWLYEFEKQNYQANFDSHWEFEILSEAILEEPILSEILTLRPTTPFSVARTAEEFKKLLQIPHCTLVLTKLRGEVLAYCVMGKGLDMLGVIHEWGAKDCETLNFCLNGLIERFYPEKLRLLSPYFIDQAWLDLFDSYASKRELMDMAWFKVFPWSNLNPEVFEKCFIWGLDSI